MEYLSSTPILISLVFCLYFDKTSAIAVPRPPIILCSSILTAIFLFLHSEIIKSSSIGFMVWTFITEQLIPLFLSSLAAFKQLFTQAPDEKIDMSLPSISLIAFPILNI